MTTTAPVRTEASSISLPIPIAIATFGVPSCASLARRKKFAAIA
ncbi:hypothetical protein [Streptomyces sp. G1]|nr:hypothetical protein [Streptomyces sp. G1]